MYKNVFKICAVVLFSLNNAYAFKDITDFSDFINEKALDMSTLKKTDYTKIINGINGTTFPLAKFPKEGQKAITDKAMIMKAAAVLVAGPYAGELIGIDSMIKEIMKPVNDITETVGDISPYERKIHCSIIACLISGAEVNDRNMPFMMKEYWSSEEMKQINSAVQKQYGPAFKHELSLLLDQAYKKVNESKDEYIKEEFVSTLARNDIDKNVDKITELLKAVVKGGVPVFKVVKMLNSPRELLDELKNSKDVPIELKTQIKLREAAYDLIKEYENKILESYSGQSEKTPRAVILDVLINLAEDYEKDNRFEKAVEISNKILNLEKHYKKTNSYQNALARLHLKGTGGVEKSFDKAVDHYHKVREGNKLTELLIQRLQDKVSKESTKDAETVWNALEKVNYTNNTPRLHNLIAQEVKKVNVNFIKNVQNLVSALCDNDNMESALNLCKAIVDSTSSIDFKVDTISTLTNAYKVRFLSTLTSGVVEEKTIVDNEGEELKEFLSKLSENTIQDEKVRNAAKRALEFFK